MYLQNKPVNNGLFRRQFNIYSPRRTHCYLESSADGGLVFITDSGVGGDIGAVRVTGRGGSGDSRGLMWR